MRYRSKDDFKVTTFEPCPLCAQMADITTLKKRDKYIYRVGWITHERGCQECYDTALKEAEEKAAAIEKATGGFDGYGY